MARIRATVGDNGGVKALFAKIAGQVSNPATLRVGFLENAKYPNGTFVAMVAAIQEFGSPKVGIPPRPFFRNMIADKQDEWPAAIRDLIVQNNYNMAAALDVAGASIAGQLRESINKTNSPGLSPVTLMLRKYFWTNPRDIRGKDVVRARERVAAGESTAGVSEKPLVWTGYLFNSVDHEVRRQS